MVPWRLSVASALFGGPSRRCLGTEIWNIGWTYTIIYGNTVYHSISENMGIHWEQKNIYDWRLYKVILGKQSVVYTSGQII
jgi:hypothetical protein